MFENGLLMFNYFWTCSEHCQNMFKTCSIMILAMDSTQLKYGPRPENLSLEAREQQRYRPAWTPDQRICQWLIRKYHRLAMGKISIF